MLWLLNLLLLWPSACLGDHEDRHDDSFIQVNPNVGTQMFQFCHKAGLLSCYQASVDMRALRTNQNLTLPDGTLVQRKSAFPGTENNETTVYFASENLESTATITYSEDPSNDEVSGILRSEGRIFYLEPCDHSPNDCHVLAEENPENLEVNKGEDLKLRRELALEEPSYEVEERGLDRGGYQRDAQGNIVATIKVYFTLQFAQVEPNVHGYITNMITETNIGYANSLIPFRLRLLCYEQLNNIAEYNNPSQTLSAFRTIKGTVQNLRGSADFAFLLVSETNSGNCGIAYLNTLSNNVGVGKHSCALSGYTFAHEVAHNMGCMHNRVATSPLSTFSYGARIASPQADSYTILSYSGGSHRRRVNFYSTPNVNYQGVPIGNTLEDNARQIRNVMIAYASIGDDSATCSARVNGGWSAWTPWTCATQCGTSRAQIRMRYCTNPTPMYGGALCQGENMEMRQGNCNTGVQCDCSNRRGYEAICPSYTHICTTTFQHNYNYMVNNCRGTCNYCQTGVRGMWSGWNAWMSCDCTAGTQSRYRYCNEPTPMNNGPYCPGSNVESRACSC